GHYTLGYSVLFPPLAWLLGPLVVGAISSVAAAAIFEPLARAHFGPGARWGSLWFGLAATTSLISGRIPFALGVALGLGSLLAFQRGRLVLAVALGLGCSLASPVAGAFLALAALLHVLRRRRGPARALADGRQRDPARPARRRPARGVRDPCRRPRPASHRSPRRHRRPHRGPAARRPGRLAVVAGDQGREEGLRRPLRAGL